MEYVECCGSLSLFVSFECNLSVNTHLKIDCCHMTLSYCIFNLVRGALSSRLFGLFKYVYKMSSPLAIQSNNESGKILRAVKKHGWNDYRFIHQNGNESQEQCIVGYSTEHGILFLYSCFALPLIWVQNCLWQYAINLIHCSAVFDLMGLKARLWGKDIQ